MGVIRETGRLFVLVGAMFIAVGVLLYFGAKLPFRLGHLPGDIVHRTKNGVFYFPVVTCLLLSAIITLLSWLMSLMKR
ncbi:MAG: DUF2905 domain-containing protein [Acidobacteria bacterium]|nr:DUF2905 domain-containing protein [Acidobacteriota bacterium]MBI3664012.1 DUF2905 domain-containing protein [Acidobacteriota bacterium]